jgi:hypothetical protein
LRPAASKEFDTLGWFELGDLAFERAADATDLRAFFGGAFRYELGVAVSARQAGLVDVGDVELRLHGDEKEVAGDEALVVGEVGGAGGLAGVEDFEELLQRGVLGLDLLVG